jgi:hypothetical protein
MNLKTVLTRVKSTKLSQPDAYTCQSACVAMALNKPASEIPKIRSQLVQMPGGAGSPDNMAHLLSLGLGNRYSLDLDASLKEVQDWLLAGELLITHGWFSQSGHVIVLDGIQADPERMSVRYDVRDPYGEFMASTWRYGGKETSYDGFYSSWIIYAACVAGVNASSAAAIYRRGELDSRRGGMWVHRIRPEA